MSNPELERQRRLALEKIAALRAKADRDASEEARLKSLMRQESRLLELIEEV